MNENIDRLYDLLPVVYRQRDAAEGWPLKALLRVIAEQVNLVEADMAQLYENWFIETCEDWVVPYLGDLVGYRLVHEAGEPGEVTTPAGQMRNKILIPRREVANTIRYRRRKGTLALLELLTNDVAGWPARVVEFYKYLGRTQALNHLGSSSPGQTVDLRQGETLSNLNGPFDELAHTVDVRRAGSHRTPGRYNIPNVGLFVWRLKAYPVSQTQAYRLERGQGLRYNFSVLRHDTPLYTRAEPETEPTEIAGPLNLPVPIRRRTMETHLEAYYGPRRSLQIWTGFPRQPVSPEAIVVADLSDWERYQPRKGEVAVDPELGRMLFHHLALPEENVKVWVSYYYGFSTELGGGEYERSLSQPADCKIYRVGEREGLQFVTAALDQWKLEREQWPRAVIEITDSGVYSEQINIDLKENQSLQIRAANRTRPVIRQLDYQPSLPDALSVTGESGSDFTVDGLLITGRPLRIQGPLREVNIRHTTLVPGWTLQPDCEPEQSLAPSLQLLGTSGTRVTIQHSILGSIQLKLNEVEDEPIPILMSDTILDATGSDLEALGAPEWRLGAPARRLAHAALTIVRSTVFGYLDVHAIDLAENCIFDGLVTVGRRQRGCMRFCYVTPGSKTPRRYHCQPDLVEQAVRVEYEQKRAQVDLTEQDRETPKAEEPRVLARERLRVRPQFNSRRYSTPTYAQLAAACAEEIKRGADDESEMGVFHDLYQPQRAANLQVRLDEYMPAGMNAGLIYAS